MSGGVILVFGGTAEGRQVSDYLNERRIPHTVCVATEYGEEVLNPGGLAAVRRGRMNREEMLEFLREQTFEAVVDATHPYAVEVSANIRAACTETGLPYLRCLRPRTDIMPDDLEDPAAERSAGETAAGPGKERLRTVRVNTAAEAADYLESRQGRIFLTTGSKELSAFTERISDRSRIFARVLPSAEVISSCRMLGLEGRQICAMQGPFSEALNEAMLRQTEAAFLVTKDTGKAGGFPEKMEAARRLGVTAVVIRRPEESGYPWEELKERLAQFSGSGGKAAAGKEKQMESTALQGSGGRRTISCVGIGMGTLATLTREGAEVIREADILFGAKRILKSVREMQGLLSDAPARRPVFIEEYAGQRISDYLSQHPQYRKIVILVSGDVGFYSGARGIRDAFPAERIRYCCGISSVQYFASRIPAAWQDAKLLSAHGREFSALNCVRRYPKLIVLVSGREDVAQICAELAAAGQHQVRVTVGTNLSYPDERIESGPPQSFTDFAARGDGGIHIMMLENPEAEHVVTPGIADDRFVRGRVPMTKEEVRILSLAKLRLHEDSVVYDIGAGTGSVSAEIARLCTFGKVYAIERNPEALELIRGNCRNLCVSNVIPVEGEAPQAMEGLPAPTHAFIGGSGGSMREIVRMLLRKNPRVRIVINVVSLESLAEAAELLQEDAAADADIVQVSAAKAKVLGRYHMMNALNPVYIISFGG